ncbi:hypothetical protein [Colwellia sp. UCD-KL20]|uniref:hypothetical protein n=1 Tax=Colwellia sp. UCD-KL20 TaxID=1917165 RepID=UPI0009713B6E|nr:hypothetical protein [Colwellia sp. UCD-KL20]
MKLYSWYDKSSQYFQDDESIKSHVEKPQVDNTKVKTQVSNRINSSHSKSIFSAFQQRYS